MDGEYRGCTPEIDPDWKILARIARRHVTAFGKTGIVIHARDAAALLTVAAGLAMDEQARSSGQNGDHDHERI